MTTEEQSGTAPKYKLAMTNGNMSSHLHEQPPETATLSVFRHLRAGKHIEKNRRR